MEHRLGLAVVLTLVNLGLLATGYGIAAAMNPRSAAREWLSFVVFAAPTVCLVGAGWVGRGTPRRRVVTAAGVVCLSANLALLARVVGISGLLGREDVLVPSWVLAGTWVTAVAAGMAAAAAAAIGWWQRRQDRLADPDADT